MSFLAAYLAQTAANPLVAASVATAAAAAGCLAAFRLTRHFDVGTDFRTISRVSGASILTGAAGAAALAWYVAGRVPTFSGRTLAATGMNPGQLDGALRSYVDTVGDAGASLATQVGLVSVSLVAVLAAVPTLAMLMADGSVLTARFGRLRTTVASAFLALFACAFVAIPAASFDDRAVVVARFEEVARSVGPLVAQMNGRRLAAIAGH